MDVLSQLDPATYAIVFSILALVSAIGAAVTSLTKSIGKLTKGLESTREINSDVMLRVIATLSPNIQQRIDQIQSQTEANERLMSTPEGREQLLKYFLSEANIMGFLSEMESRVTQDEEMDIEVLMVEASKDKKWYTNAGEWFKNNKGAFTEKLFGKANDLVKTILPTSSNEK